MSGFFSHSSSRRRYPDPNMGGKHYRKKGLFGMFPDLGVSPVPEAPEDTPAVSGQTICPKCGTSVPAGSKFCLECGEKIASAPGVCSKCGKSLPAGAKFCLECGTPVQR